MWLQMLLMLLLLTLNPPLITVCELHVHGVAAEEGLGVQRDFDVGGVGDWITDQNQVRHRRLLLSVTVLLSLDAVNVHVTRAVKHLETHNGKNTVILGQQNSFSFCLDTY